MKFNQILILLSLLPVLFVFGLSSSALADPVERVGCRCEVDDSSMVNLNRVILGGESGDEVLETRTLHQYRGFVACKSGACSKYRNVCFTKDDALTQP